MVNPRRVSGRKHETKTFHRCLILRQAEDEKPRPEDKELILRHYTAKGTGPASVDAWFIPQCHYVASVKTKRGATHYPKKGADR